MDEQMTISLEAYQLAYRPYAVHLAQEELSDGSVCWVAEHPTLGGCMTQGDTEGEALWNLNDARLTWIQACLDGDIPIPPPENENVQTIMKMYSLGVKT